MRGKWETLPKERERERLQGVSSRYREMVGKKQNDGSGGDVSTCIDMPSVGACDGMSVHTLRRSAPQVKRQVKIAGVTCLQSVQLVAGMLSKSRLEG